MNADVKYFVDCNGATVELSRVNLLFLDSIEGGIPVTVADSQTQFADGCHRRPVDRRFLQRNRQFFIGFCTCGRRHIAERRIFRPAKSKHHKCNAICLNAKGGTCSCECGGANHGKGVAA